GTLGVAPTATITNYGPASITLAGGTIEVQGSLQLGPGVIFNFQGGTMKGPGTFATPSGGTVDVSGTNSQMFFTNGLIFDNFGNFNYHPPTNVSVLSING